MPQWLYSGKTRAAEDIALTAFCGGSPSWIASILVILWLGHLVNFSTRSVFG